MFCAPLTVRAEVFDVIPETGVKTDYNYSESPNGSRLSYTKITDANGNVVINEYKSSLTAPLTSNQKIAFPEIFESGATVVGKGKGIFSGGYQIPPGTKVTIIK